MEKIAKQEALRQLASARWLVIIIIWPDKRE